MALLLLLLAAAQAGAQLPISGRPVFHAADGTFITEFYEIDSRIQALMQTNGIEAGVVGIQRGGKTIYLRAFGWLNKPSLILPLGVPLPETAMFRVASVTKVVTAAAIHAMAEDNLLGPAGLNRKAFNLPGNDGILFVPPFGPLGDPDFANINVSHLLGHAGGFRREDDPYNNLRAVATNMNTLSPPDVFEIMRWRLGQPLKEAPGTRWGQNWGNAAQTIISNVGAGNPAVITTTTAHGYQSGDTVKISGHTGSVPNINGKHQITRVNSTQFSIPLNVTTNGTGGTNFNESFDPYSNFGFNVLGRIVETAPGGYDNFVRSRVLSAENWIPSTDWTRARTFLADCHPREPRYQGTMAGETAPNIYDNDEPYEQVESAYGGFSLESGFYAGGLVASAQALLQFGKIFQVGYTPPSPGVNHNLGARITPANRPLSGEHTGGFTGTSSILRRESRGTVSNINSSGAGDPAVISTTLPHGYRTGETVLISGHTGSVPDINGTHTITVIDSNRFSIPVNVEAGGTSGTVRNSTDDLLIFIVFTKLPPSGDGYATLAFNEVMSVLNTIPPNRWPDAECDGFWVKPGNTGSSGRGGYNDEYSSLSHALAIVGSGSKLQLKAGTSPWTGVISNRMLLTAPQGSFTIGQP